MTTTPETVSIEGKYYADGVNDLADGEDWDVNPEDTPYGAVEIHSFVHGGGCDVKYLQDKNQDGTYEINVTIDSLTGSGISQHNKVQAGENAEEVIRITNTSGSPADFAITGVTKSQ